MNNEKILENLASALIKKEKDVRFCNAYALTRIGQDALRSSKENLKHKFVLRNSYTERGFTFKRAEKADENPQVVIEINRWYTADRDSETRLRPEMWVPNRAGFFKIGIGYNQAIPPAYSASRFEKTKFDYSGPRSRKPKHHQFKINKFGRDAIAHRPNRKTIIVLHTRRQVQTKAENFFVKPISDKFNDFSIYYDEAWKKYVD